MAEKKMNNEDKKGPCRCPYCDMKITDNEAEYCPFCNFKVIHCPSCSYPVSDKMEKCPNCGARL
jgi:RNA polymerase subunit RPABC4/transcription elongation factor Spt4